jgi:hypothetical protein
MASKKKSIKKKARKSASRLSKPAKKKLAKPVRKPAKKKSSKTRPTAKKKSLRSKTAAGSAQRRSSGRASGRRQDDSTYPFSAPLIPTEVEAGDLQGLSDRESADSESVDELLEEGNAFEAGVVSGVEDADNNDEREVHTRELPEDDVPEEYLDQD